jgi:IS30 family transposase
VTPRAIRPDTLIRMAELALAGWSWRSIARALASTESTVARHVTRIAPSTRKEPQPHGHAH